MGCARIGCEVPLMDCGPRWSLSSRSLPRLAPLREVFEGSDLTAAIKAAPPAEVGLPARDSHLYVGDDSKALSSAYGISSRAASRAPPDAPPREPAPRLLRLGALPEGPPSTPRRRGVPDVVFLLRVEYTPSIAGISCPAMSREDLQPNASGKAAGPAPVQLSSFEHNYRCLAASLRA